jgi:hypothetical protein
MSETVLIVCLSPKNFDMMAPVVRPIPTTVTTPGHSTPVTSNGSVFSSGGRLEDPSSPLPSQGPCAGARFFQHLLHSGTLF